MHRDGVTIAIPNWNHEILLPRAIQSALRAVQVIRKQGGEGEILVVDDHSRDGSVNLLRQLEAYHFRDGFRVLALGKNAGVAGARNAALKNASFRQIVFLDADNELLPPNLPYFSQSLRETGATAAYGTLLVRTVSGPEGFNVVSNESFHDQMFDGNHIDAFAIFDCGQLLDLGGYNDAFSTTADHEQWLHLACNGRRILFVPMVFGFYYVMPKSMSQDDQGLWEREYRRSHRIFNQTKARRHLPLVTRHLRYHPHLGFL